MTSVRPPFSPELASEIRGWDRSSVIPSRMQGLVSKGLIRPLTAAREWIIPQGESEPAPPPGYVVAPVSFFERGFWVPPHWFLRGSLFEYGIELHHLTPNGLVYIAGFVALCEGYLGIEPNWDLFRYFFRMNLLKRDSKHTPVGCAGICLRTGRGKEFLDFFLLSTNKGWHEQWVYLRNDPEALLPPYTGSVFLKAKDRWGRDLPAVDRQRLQGLVTAIKSLRTRG